MANTLLSSLAMRLSAHPENIATESLLYILKEHPASRDALATLLEHSGLPKFADLTYRSQVYGDQGEIPDLVGFASSGEESLVIEAKFWAQLTDNQPETYLKRLNPQNPSVLMFVCPENRKRTLWDQLLNRLENKAHQLENSIESHSVIWSKVNPNQFLAILSWRALLSSLIADAIALNNQNYLADVNQLQGLCDRMDSEAFLPLRPSELSQEIGKRISQFADIVDEAMLLLRSRNKDISTKNLTVGTSKTLYGRYFKYKEVIGGYLYFSPPLWAESGVSPMWLKLTMIINADWEVTPHLKKLLVQAAVNYPTRVSADEQSIALILPCGAEKQEVLEEIVRQTIEVLALL